MSTEENYHCRPDSDPAPQRTKQTDLAKLREQTMDELENLLSEAAFEDDCYAALDRYAEAVAQQKLAAALEDSKRLTELLARWLKVYTDAASEAQEVGYAEYNITAGLVSDTRAAIDAARQGGDK